MATNGVRSAQPASGDQIQALHVDDDPRFLEIAAEFLEREADNIDVTVATSANEALDILTCQPVDCVVSDYDMPDRDGIDLLNEIRAEWPDLPFILFTGKGSERVASEAFSAGATDYIQKESGTDQYTILANRIENVVERTRAEAQRSRHLEAIESAREGISILDSDGYFVYVNDAYADLYGYEPEGMVGKHWKLVYPEEEVSFARDEIIPTVETEGYWHGETTGLRADGSIFPEDHVVSATDKGDLVCTVRDLSKRNEWQEQLTRYRTLVETLNDPVYVLDETGRFEYVNDALVEKFGYSRERILGTTPSVIKDDEAVATAEAQLGRILSSEGPDHARFEVDIQPKDGDPIRCEDHMGVLPYDGESFDGSVGMLRDISDRVERERELERQNERLDEFASLVSHDLRNPLRTAALGLELATEDCGSEHLDEAIAAVDRSQSLIDDILTLAREGEAVTDLESVSLADAVERSWEMVETGDATLVTDVSRTIRADESRLQRLLTNLLENAISHGGDGVTVTVGERDEGFFVADDGPGIPPEDRERVFDAGYTTSATGTGFGLRIAEQVAEVHGWDVTISESSSGGARVDVVGVEG